MPFLDEAELQQAYATQQQNYQGPLNEAPTTDLPALVGSQTRDDYAIQAQGTITAETGVITAQKILKARDESLVRAKLRLLAAQAGDDWGYSFPVKGSQKPVEGPSIKCAMSVAREFGNCMVDVRVVEESTAYVFYGRFVDLETGFQVTRPFRQRKSQGSLKTSADRQEDIVFQIGASKATRNVVCNALEHLTDYAFRESKKAVIIAVRKNLEQYKAKVLDRLQEMGVDLARVEKAIGVPAREWIDIHIARLVAEIRAIQDGMGTPNDLWPPITPQEKTVETPTETVKETVKEATKEPTHEATRETVETAEPQTVKGLAGRKGGRLSFD